MHADRLSVKELTLGFYQLAAGLDALHSKDIVSQDVHCGNVLLSQDGRTWKLADLGSGTRAKMNGQHNWTDPKNCRSAAVPSCCADVAFAQHNS